MRVVVLTLTTGSLLGLGVLAVSLVSGSGHGYPAALAGVVCLGPAVVTLATIDRVGRRIPDLRPAVILLGGGVRGLAAVAAVVVLTPGVAAAGVPRERFVGWVTAAYIITLAVESALLVWATPTGPDEGGRWQQTSTRPTTGRSP